VNNSSLKPSNFIDVSDKKENDLVLIVENVGEKLNVKTNETNNTILEGVCAVFGQKNNNQRVYEKDEYLPHLEYLKEKIKTRQLVGDLDHPPSFEVTLKSASHIIEGLDHDGGDKVNIKLRILENTPNGKIAKALIDGGVNISISSRAAGQVLNEGKVKLHRIFTYDLVAEPGFTEAVLKKTVNESLKENFEMITENYSLLKENSFINKEKLEDISENLNFSNNYKFYKINNKNNKELTNSLSNQNNKSKMNEYVNKNDMNHYTEIVKEKFESLQAEMDKIKSVNEADSKEVKTTDVSPTSGIGKYVNYLAEKVENLTKYTDYLSGKLNQSVKYTEHVAETTNNSIEYQNYIGEKLNQSLNYQNYLGENLNKSINYQDYLKENLNKSINYQTYLAEELDKGIQYTEYVAEGANKGIEFAEYIAENAQMNREYVEYVAEKSSKGISYAEYIAESLNSGKFTPNSNLLSNVSGLNENKQIEMITEGIDAVINTVKSESASAVLENKYPFLKVLSEKKKEAFYDLDTNTKQAVVEAVRASVWFNEADVTGIISAVVENANKSIPNHLRYMPDEYKASWEKMNEAEKNQIHTKTQLYTLNTPYQVKSFWDEIDFRGINERIEREKENRKLQQINESQSTEGAIPVDRVVDMTRGYSQTYIDSLMRGAENRNK
tara:strand:- start:25401 stop:27404 length:2004 start_codon:yes stop_codon:yes gene_type:complete